jgi:predicted esterase
LVWTPGPPFTSVAPGPVAAMWFLKKALLSLVRILLGVPIVSLLLVGFLFLALGATWRGRCVGLSAVLLGAALFCSVGYWNRKWFKRVRRRFYAVLLPISLVLLLVPMILAPDGGGAEDGHVRNCFLHGKGEFAWYSPWNVVPEVDQVTVGTTLLPLFDPYVDFAKARKMRSLELSVYDVMEKDAGFHALGSVMGTAYRELFRVEFRTGHYYLFLPEVRQGERLPCLVYLHGLGGNNKSHFWVLTRISAQMKCAVIAPSFGMGNWEKRGGAELAVEVAHEALATLPLDPERLFLLGYSNGALGVTRAAVKEPGLFKGLIYLSPVTEDELFSVPEFQTHGTSCRILFLHGGQDRRIPRDLVERTAATLERLGGDVRLKVYDDEDHYLLLSRRQAVVDDLIEWMTAP